jgi:hypothetical protein
MPRMSKIEVFGVIRRDRAAGMSGRAIEQRRHTVRLIYHRLLDEHGMAEVSYQVVRNYVADRKPKIRAETGREPIKVFFPQTTSSCDAARGRNGIMTSRYRD